MLPYSITNMVTLKNSEPKPCTYMLACKVRALANWGAQVKTQSVDCAGFSKMKKEYKHG